MADVTIKYNNNEIATMNASGTKTLLTNGKYCANDFTVQYTKPSVGSGGNTGTTLVQAATFTPTTTGVLNLTSLFPGPGTFFGFSIFRDTYLDEWDETDENSICFASIISVAFENSQKANKHTARTKINSTSGILELINSTSYGSMPSSATPNNTTASNTIRLNSSNTNRILVYVGVPGENGFRIGKTYTIVGYKNALVL